MLCSTVHSETLVWKLPGFWKRMWNSCIFLICLFAGINIGFLTWSIREVTIGHSSHLLKKLYNRPALNSRAITKSRPRGILLGIMTANKFVEKRVNAALQTWAYDKCTPTSNSKWAQVHDGFYHFTGSVVFFGERDFNPFNDTSPSCDLRNHLTPFKSEDTVCRTSLGQRVRRSCFVSLPNLHVINEYPPMKKAFSMLKYMYTHYYHNTHQRPHQPRYDWFVRIDDDTYSRPGLLQNFLNSLDPSKPLYIGQMGIGRAEDKPTRDLFIPLNATLLPITNIKGKQKLVRIFNYCMSGTGFIISRALMRQIGPHLDNCLKETASIHDDVEIGRCITKISGGKTHCSWAYDAKSYFHHIYQKHDKLASKRAITVHPLKTSKIMYLTHYIYKVEYLKKAIQSRMTIIKRRNEIKKLKRSNPTKIKIHRVKHKFQIPVYNLISRGGKVMFTTAFHNPQINIPSKSFTDYEKLMNATLKTSDGIKAMSAVYPRNTHFVPSLYFEHSQPGGLDRNLYIRCHFQNLTKRYQNQPIRAFNKVKVFKANKNVKFNRNPFNEGHLFAIKIPYQPLLFEHEIGVNEHINVKKTLINVIVPFIKRYDILFRFLKSFENMVLTKNTRVSKEFDVRLFVAHFVELGLSNPKKDEALKAYKSVLRYVRGLNYKYGYKAEGPIITIHHAQNTPFSRAKALNFGASLLASHELILFLDVDMQFDNAFLKRAVSFSRRGVSAYFPIVFSYYNYSKSNMALRSSSNKLKDSIKLERSSFEVDHRPDQGFWNIHGYGICAIYGSDLWTAGGYDASITQWGKEDIDLFSKILTDTKLIVYRAPDPGIVHIYHDRACSGDIEAPDQYIMCMNSMTSYIADKVELAKSLNYSFSPLR